MSAPDAGPNILHTACAWRAASGLIVAENRIEPCTADDGESNGHIYRLMLLRFGHPRLISIHGYNLLIVYPKLSIPGHHNAPRN
jgi:hypothetical protein